MLNKTQKTLLAMQAVLDQMQAIIDTGLTDPECDQVRDTVEQLRTHTRLMANAVEAELETMPE